MLNPASMSLDRHVMNWDTARIHAKILQLNMRDLGLENMPYDGTILDIGCGDGKLIAELSKLYPEAKFCGLDRYIGDAKKNNPEADLREGYFHEMPFDDGSITIAVSFNIFQYAEEEAIVSKGRKNICATFKLADFAREVNRVLISGGLYIPIEGDIRKSFTNEYWEIFYRNFKSIAAPNCPDNYLIFQEDRGWKG